MNCCFCLKPHFCLPAAFTALLGMLLLFSSFPAASADVPAIFHFHGSDGAHPVAALVLGRDGNFYGTTSQGGDNNNGTIFQMTTAGVLTTLVNFDGPHGAYPAAALVLGPDGSFYGTTGGGGSGNVGTVFKVTTDGTPAGTALTTLVNFHGSNGAYPHAALVLGRDGNFYGTTSQGGDNNGGNGTVFQMTPAGVLTTLVNFQYSQGSDPLAALIQGRDGGFYGTTGGGGSGDGTVFKLTTNGTAAGTTLTTLFQFHLTDGGYPTAALVQGNDGSFYGTTYQGGSDEGTAFKLTTDGTAAGTTLTTLVNFTYAGGIAPAAALVQDGSSFYGATAFGGSNNAGTVFKLTTDGSQAGTTLTTLVNFRVPNGSAPDAALVPGRDGRFYGTTVAGGSAGVGTVFQIGPPTARNGALTIPKNQRVSLALRFFDPDGDQAAQRYTLGLPIHGTLARQSVSYDSASGQGVLIAVYAPDAGFTGTDSFDFTVTNGLGVSRAAAYSLTVLSSSRLQSLKFNPMVVMGGGATIGEVTLTSPATVPTTVTLTSSNPAVLPVRSAVTIIPGHRTAHFTVSSHPVLTTTEVFVSATLDGVTTTSAATISASQAPLSSVTTAPTRLVGGRADALGSVALALATTDSVTVTLTSSDPAALSVRPSVTVTAGHRQALFTAFSHPVTTAKTVTVTAVAGGVTKTTPVMVIP